MLSHWWVSTKLCQCVLLLKWNKKFPKRHVLKCIIFCQCVVKKNFIVRFNIQMYHTIVYMLSKFQNDIFIRFKIGVIKLNFRHYLGNFYELKVHFTVFNLITLQTAETSMLKTVNKFNTAVSYCFIFVGNKLLIINFNTPWFYKIELKMSSRYIIFMGKPITLRAGLPLQNRSIKDCKHLTRAITSSYVNQLICSEGVKVALVINYIL